MKNLNNLPSIIPIFPLSNFIIFPHTTVPLNIFEPRYVDMVNESMKTNKIIGLIQPKTNNISNISDLHTVGCLGEITNFKDASDGRCLIELKGLSRFNILKEDLNLWGKYIILGTGAGASIFLRGNGLDGIASHTELTRLLSEHGLFGFIFISVSMKMMNMRCKNVMEPFPEDERVQLMQFFLAGHADIDVHEIARETEGYSPAELERLCR